MNTNQLSGLTYEDFEDVTKGPILHHEPLTAKNMKIYALQADDQVQAVETVGPYAPFVHKGSIQIIGPGGINVKLDQPAKDLNFAMADPVDATIQVTFYGPNDEMLASKQYESKPEYGEWIKSPEGKTIKRFEIKCLTIRVYIDNFVMYVV
ncbi:hypothetical protein AB7M22_003863 [Pseudomonas sp. ADAK2 TE3594]